MNPSSTLESHFPFLFRQIDSIYYNQQFYQIYPRFIIIIIIVTDERGM
jgi:hypothetical protein